MFETIGRSGSGEVTAGTAQSALKRTAFKGQVHAAAQRGEQRLLDAST